MLLVFLSLCKQKHTFFIHKWNNVFSFLLLLLTLFFGSSFSEPRVERRERLFFSFEVENLLVYGRSSGHFSGQALASSREVQLPKVKAVCTIRRVLLELFYPSDRRKGLARGGGRGTGKSGIEWSDMDADFRTSFELVSRGKVCALSWKCIGRQSSKPTHTGFVFSALFLWTAITPTLSVPYRAIPYQQCCLSLLGHPVISREINWLEGKRQDPEELGTMTPSPLLTWQQRKTGRAAVLWAMSGAQWPGLLALPISFLLPSYFLFGWGVYELMCVSVCVCCMCACACTRICTSYTCIKIRGQLLIGQSFLLPLWDPEIKLRSSGIQSKPFYLLNHVPGPVFGFVLCVWSSSCHRSSISSCSVYPLTVFSLKLSMSPFVSWPTLSPKPDKCLISEVVG